MLRWTCTLVACLAITGSLQAQDMYLGHNSIGSREPLFPYDDQEPWKHGYLQEMPYYGGYHSFRPYNYKQVFSQSQTAAGWGMPSTMPYSQQFWHRYANQTDLSIGGGIGTMPTPAPVPVEQAPVGPWAPVQQSPVYSPIGYQQPVGYGYAAPVQQTPVQQYLYGR
jgi:hypothetical protein